MFDETRPKRLFQQQRGVEEAAPGARLFYSRNRKILECLSMAKAPVGGYFSLGKGQATSPPSMTETLVYPAASRMRWAS